MASWPSTPACSSPTPAAFRARLDALHKPLLAVLVTHGHPDHFNGVVELVRGQGDVPIYATPEGKAVIDEVAEPKRAQWSPTYGDEWPTRDRLPQRGRRRRRDARDRRAAHPRPRARAVRVGQRGALRRRGPRRRRARRLHRRPVLQRPPQLQRRRLHRGAWLDALDRAPRPARRDRHALPRPRAPGRARGARRPAPLPAHAARSRPQPRPRRAVAVGRRQGGADRAHGGLPARPGARVARRSQRRRRRRRARRRAAVRQHAEAASLQSDGCARRFATSPTSSRWPRSSTSRGPPPGSTSSSRR